jgi:outer membrane receptor protein involved in Fe transport
MPRPSLLQHRFLFLLPLLVLAFSASAQRSLRGVVVENGSARPVPYATVVALPPTGETPLAGTSTDDAGAFRLSAPADAARLRVSFIGYRDTTLALRDGRLDADTIVLRSASRRLEEVAVTAERSVVEFQLDKRVFRVGQDLASAGMGALDVLNNVPSVNVDVEGQVSLRGNTGVQILINGKPSVLSDEGAAALGTLTADMIEAVEVITNPSAKYEAEGSSGIINIVLKKEEKKGFNGSISANTGLPANHSLGVSLNRRTENFNFFTQFGAGYRSLPDSNRSVNLNRVDSTLVLSGGTEFRNERFANITLGTDYHIDERNVLTLSGSFAYEDEDQPSETRIEVLDNDGLVTRYLREETTTAGNPKYQYDLQYERRFRNDEDHVLQFSTQGNFFGKVQESAFTHRLLDGAFTDPDQRTATDFYQQDFLFKFDYVNPLSDAVTLETGAQYDLNDVGNAFSVSNRDSSGAFVVDSGLTNDFRWDQRVLGVYATGAWERDAWGVKGGLRVEYTDLNTLLATTGQANRQRYTNLFPSLHASYKISPRVSVQAGYSRRIYRPRLWDLNPFFNIRNNYNVRRGNPDLLPEFADSWELTGIVILDKASFNASAYHLRTTDVIERVSFFEGNVSVTAPVNVGTRNQTGFELNGKYTPTSWLSVNGDVNYGMFVRDGRYEGQDFDFRGRQWFARVTARFKLPAALEVEITGDYNSPFRTVQGMVSGFAFMDAGLRKKFWNGKLVTNVSVRDAFASRIRESAQVQPGFYRYDFSRRGRFLTLGVSYSFGKGEAMTYSGRRY